MGLLNNTIGECLKRRVVETPNISAAAYEDECYTWAELDEISDYLAVHCLKIGISKGTHVAIWGVNSFSWIAHFFALEKIGAIPVLINICYRASELTDVLQYADVEFLFRGIRCKDTDYELVAKTLDFSRLPKLRRIIEMESIAETPWKTSKNYCVLSQDNKILLAEAVGKVYPDDIACMLFTSGTTSLPKGVLLTHNNLINNSLQHSKSMRWTKQDKMCVCVPLFHCFGITVCILAALHCGASLQLVKYYSTTEVLRTIHKYRCTILSGVPSMFLALINNKEFANYDISSITSGVIAGSPLPPDDYIKVCTALNKAKLQPAYGQTESSPCITMASYEDSIEKKSTSSGKVIPEIEVRIFHEATKTTLSAGQRGEIEVRGYNVMKGYYNLPDATKATIRADGWLRTGDEGYFDEEGYLHVTGRIKDIIIRGGENISPTEVEAVLHQIEDVQDVKVVGMPTKIMQEKVVACIVLQKGKMLTSEYIKDYVLHHLAAYKTPEDVLFFDKFPMTPSGKINQKELKQQVATKLSAINLTAQ